MTDRAFEPFVVRHYAGDERPTIKGNGFDGLEVGETRDEAEAFVAWVNAAVQAAIKHERAECAKVCEEVLKAGDVFKDYEDNHEDGHTDGCNNCAAAIRARS